MADIFISYKKERRAYVERIASILEAYGYDVWWDAELVVGPEYRNQIEKQLDAAKVVLVLWDSASIFSRFVCSEASRAERRKKLVEAYLEDVEAPVGFGESQGARIIDWRGDPRDPSLMQLVGALSDHIRREPLIPTSLLNSLSGLPALPSLDAVTVAEADVQEVDQPLEFESGLTLVNNESAVSETVQPKGSRRGWMVVIFVVILGALVGLIGRMNWLLAMVALVATCFILSFIVMIFVEAVHILFNLRHSGLRHMMRFVYRSLIHRGYLTYSSSDEDHPKTRELLFANEMTRASMFGYIRHSGIFNLGERKGARLDKLSKRQFVEHLAETDFGQELGQKPRTDIRSTLNWILHQFERAGIGETQSFRARAKILTNLIALLIVVLGNFNALALYTYLAKDPGASTAISNIVQNNPEIVGQIVDKKIQASMEAGEGDPQVEDLVVSVAERFRDMKELGLPVGRDFFPYCFEPYAPGCDIETDIQPVKLPFIHYTSEAIPRILTSEGFVWFIGMIAMAGLISVGAQVCFYLLTLVRREFSKEELANAESDVGKLTDRFILSLGRNENFT